MLKHYVEFIHPGIFVCETSVKEVETREVEKISLSDDSFGFRFFDRTETITDGELLIGGRKNVSGWYYQGEKMTFEQVMARFGNSKDHEILISNMEINGIKALVKTKFGQYIPLGQSDTVI